MCLAAVHQEQQDRSVLEDQRRAIVELLARPQPAKSAVPPGTPEQTAQRRLFERGVRVQDAIIRTPDFLKSLGPEGTPPGLQNATIGPVSPECLAIVTSVTAGLGRMTGRDHADILKQLREAGTGAMAREAAEIIYDAHGLGRQFPRAAERVLHEATVAATEQKLLDQVHLVDDRDETSPERMRAAWDLGRGRLPAVDKLIRQELMPAAMAFAGRPSPAEMLDSAPPGAAQSDGSAQRRDGGRSASSAGANRDGANRGGR